ncbi:MAG: glycosyltransferase family 2 protein [Actinomycetota bacterium]
MEDRQDHHAELSSRQSQDGDPRTRVAICALTYQRPTGLARLLTELDSLTVPDGHTVDVVIVDNAPDRSAEEAVTAHGATAPFPVLYVNEPARGISTARNAAVGAALDLGADLICFLDDDEWPEPDWLVEFLATRAATGADIVTGPVFAVFDEEPPAWVLEGGFFDRRRHDHHERIGYATTSTVMISADTFTSRTPPNDREPFDLAFGMSGGEDTHLFAELVAEGRTIVWCDTANVHESIPASKVDARWLLRREYRRGQTLSLSLRRRGASPWRYVRRVGNGLQHVFRGVGRLAIGVVRGRAARFAGLHQIVFGIGMWTGLAGLRFEEYAVTHGS